MLRRWLVFVACVWMVGCAPKSSELPEEVAGSCEYTNPFSGLPECRAFLGTGWTQASAKAECDDSSGMYTANEGCAPGPVLGQCILGGGTDKASASSPRTDNAGEGGSNKQGCELFGGGAWIDSEVCGGATGEGYTPSGARVFIPPRQICSEPLEGEAPSESEDGQVCVWATVGGCVEPGRKYIDYASCEEPISQRSYYPKAANEEQMAKEDPRLEDPEFVTELDWVKEQVEACGCVCCHDSRITPEAPSNWYVDAPGNFLATFFDSGIAFGANLTDSSALGAYPPEQNNGFERTTVGIPSTDPARMRKFFEDELAHRGKSAADYPGYESAVPVIDNQRFFEPSACENGEGVSSDGTITWEGGRARYVYVMEKGTEGPITPPNLDIPTGTMGRIDVAYKGVPIESGSVTYGAVPEALAQARPKEGEAPALEAGKEYYLYVTADVLIPITRCLFTYE